MKDKINVGFELRRINLLFKKTINSIAKRNGGSELTGMHMMLLGYLDKHSDREIYQKDIASLFAIRNSTATSLIQLMEKKGLIKRESVGKDARLKKLLLTPEGAEISRNTKKEYDELNNELLGCRTKEELDLFIGINDKFRKILIDYGGEND